MKPPENIAWRCPACGRTLQIPITVTSTKASSTLDITFDKPTLHAHVREHEAELAAMWS